MATFFIRLTVYDPEVIAALTSLRRSRKQSAFVVEALRHLLSTEGGRQLLQSMTGTVRAETNLPLWEGRSSNPLPESSSLADLDDIFRR